MIDISKFKHQVIVLQCNRDAAAEWCHANIDDGGNDVDESFWEWYCTADQFIDGNRVHIFGFDDKEIATWFELTFA